LEITRNGEEAGKPVFLRNQTDSDEIATPTVTGIGETVAVTAAAGQGSTNMDRAVYQGASTERDAGNSSTATLAALGVFTGTGIALDDGTACLIVQVDSDQNSGTDKLRFQFSQDNSNWDLSLDYTYKADKQRTYVLPRLGNFFRLMYTNGGTAQNHFRLETYQVGASLGQVLTAAEDSDPEDACAALVKAAPHRRCVAIASATISGNATTAIVAAPGAGSKIVVHKLWLATQKSHSGTGNGGWKFASGSSHFSTELPEDFQQEVSFKSDALWVGGDNEALNYQTANNANTEITLTVLYDLLPCSDVS